MAGGLAVPARLRGDLIDEQVFTRRQLFCGCTRARKIPFIDGPLRRRPTFSAIRLSGRRP